MGGSQRRESYRLPGLSNAAIRSSWVSVSGDLQPIRSHVPDFMWVGKATLFSYEQMRLPCSDIDRATRLRTWVSSGPTLVCGELFSVMGKRPKRFWQGLTALGAVFRIAFRQPATATNAAHAPTSTLDVQVVTR